MMLRLQPYDLRVMYRPGKEIPIGDALSRANLPDSEPDFEEVRVNTIDFIAVTPSRYRQFQQGAAEELNELHQIIQEWPDAKEETPHCVRPFWNSRDELSIADGIVLKGMRIVIPPSQRPEMLKQSHASHLGITKCKQRAREALFWPGMTRDIENLVTNCELCNTYQNKQVAEPLKPTMTHDLPWIKVASDIFDWRGDHYLLVVDYLSRYIEVDKLKDMSSTETIEVIKSQICRHSIPAELRTDNGPQYSSKEFEFCNQYGIQHVTSAPAYPQSNREAERAVQTVKRLWSKCEDKQLALLDYRTTPLESCGLSPAQLLMGRRPRNKLPTMRELLKPATHDTAEVKRRMDEDKKRQKQYHDQLAGGDLPVLVEGDPVRMAPFPGSKKWLPATVVSHHDSPRSYIVEHNGRKYRRNRRHLRVSTYKGLGEAHHSAETSHSGGSPQLNPKDTIEHQDAMKLQHVTPVNPGSSGCVLSPASEPTPAPKPVSSPRAMTSPAQDMAAPTTPKVTYTRSGRKVQQPCRLNL